jgi:hypothetical protein
LHPVLLRYSSIPAPSLLLLFQSQPRNPCLQKFLMFYPQVQMSCLPFELPLHLLLPPVMSLSHWIIFASANTSSHLPQGSSRAEAIAFSSLYPQHLVQCQVFMNAPDKKNKPHILTRASEERTL